MSGHWLHASIDGTYTGQVVYRLECQDDCGTLDMHDQRIEDSECWLIDWLDNVGTEMIGGEWPDDPKFPLPVRWQGSPDEPQIVYAGAVQVTRPAEPVFFVDDEDGEFCCLIAPESASPSEEGER